MPGQDNTEFRWEFLKQEIQKVTIPFSKSLNKEETKYSRFLLDIFETNQFYLDC